MWRLHMASSAVQAVETGLRCRRRSPVATVTTACVTFGISGGCQAGAKRVPMQSQCKANAKPMQRAARVPYRICQYGTMSSVSSHFRRLFSKLWDAAWIQKTTWKWLKFSTEWLCRMCSHVTTDLEYKCFKSGSPARKFFTLWVIPFFFFGAWVQSESVCKPVSNIPTSIHNHTHTHTSDISPLISCHHTVHSTD